MNDLEMLLKDYEPKHSAFQIANFIVGSAGDEWLQYKQALREIKSRIESLQKLKEDKQLFELSKKSIRRKLKMFFMHPVRRKIFKKKQDRVEAALSENIWHTSRELREFEAIAKRLKDRIGKLTNGDRQRLEAQSWLNKTRFMIQLDLLTTGSIGRASAEMAYSLPKYLQKKLDLKNFRILLNG